MGVFDKDNYHTRTLRLVRMDKPIGPTTFVGPLMAGSGCTNLKSDRPVCAGINNYQEKC